MITSRALFAGGADSVGNFYALGGVSSFNGNMPVFSAAAEILRPGTSAWSGLTSASAPFVAAQAALGPNGLFYVPGGLAPGPTGTTQIYDPVGNAWSTGPSLKVSTAYCGAAASNTGTIYVFGGTNTLSTPIASSLSSEQLTAPDAGWALTVNPMPTPRCEVGTAVDQAGRVYAIGGNNCVYSGTVIQYDNIEILDPASGWLASPRPALLNGVQGPACTAAHDGRIFCFGGYNGAATTHYVQVYNPQTQGVLSSP
jgi:N-acetylneuraminic acid mutarotase